MQNGKRSIFDIQPGFERKHIWALLGILALYFVTRVVMPTDLYTTALWLDSLGRPTPWSGQLDSAIYRFLDSLIPTQVSVEGMTFSVMLTLTQLMATYKMFSSGDWIEGRPGLSFIPATWGIVKNILKKDGAVRTDSINGRKYAWLFFWTILVIFDSYTSYSYRIAGAASEQKMIVFLTYAVLYENVLSEIVFGESVRAVLVSAAVLLMGIPAFRNFTNEWRDNWDSGKRPGKPSKNSVSSQPTARPAQPVAPPRRDGPSTATATQQRSSNGARPNGNGNGGGPVRETPSRRPETLFIPADADDAELAMMAAMVSQIASE